MYTTVAHKVDKKWRSADISVEKNIDFSGLMLSENVLEGLRIAGFVTPSPIQLEAIPLGRCGLDLIVQAKSGTGKTCVFAIIALESVNTQSIATQVLILAPTREVAVQISEVINVIGRAVPSLRCYAFIGGINLEEDKKKLRKCHIIVGTPGRIKQLIQEKWLDTSHIRLFVLDEADVLISEMHSNIVKCQGIYDALHKQGWPVEHINGSQEQMQRLETITRLKKYATRILVSTDLTSRGIDAENVNLVINVDVPWTAETYLHRIGRAGRYGSRGLAVSLVGDDKEWHSLLTIKQTCHLDLHILPDPIPKNIWNLHHLAEPYKMASAQEIQLEKDTIQIDTNEDSEVSSSVASKAHSTEPNLADDLSTNSANHSDEHCNPLCSDSDDNANNVDASSVNSTHAENRMCGNDVTTPDQVVESDTKNPVSEPNTAVESSKGVPIHENLDQASKDLSDSKQSYDNLSIQVEKIAATETSEDVFKAGKCDDLTKLAQISAEIEETALEGSSKTSKDVFPQINEELQMHSNANIPNGESHALSTKDNIQESISDVPRNIFDMPIFDVKQLSGNNSKIPPSFPEIWQFSVNNLGFDGDGSNTPNSANNAGRYVSYDEAENMLKEFLDSDHDWATSSKNEFQEIRTPDSEEISKLNEKLVKYHSQFYDFVFNREGKTLPTEENDSTKLPETTVPKKGIGRKESKGIEAANEAVETISSTSLPDTSKRFETEPAVGVFVCFHDSEESTKENDVACKENVVENLDNEEETSSVFTEDITSSAESSDNENIVLKQQDYIRKLAHESTRYYAKKNKGYTEISAQACQSQVTSSSLSTSEDESVVSAFGEKPSGRENTTNRPNHQPLDSAFNDLRIVNGRLGDKQEMAKDPMRKQYKKRKPCTKPSSSNNRVTTSHNYDGFTQSFASAACDASGGTIKRPGGGRPSHFESVDNEDHYPRPARPSHIPSSQLCHACKSSQGLWNHWWQGYYRWWADCYGCESSSIFYPNCLESEWKVEVERISAYNSVCCQMSAWKKLWRDQLYEWNRFYNFQKANRRCH